MYNKFVGSAIQLNRGGKLVCGCVKDCVRDDAGNLVGKQYQKKPYGCQLLFRLIR